MRNLKEAYGEPEQVEAEDELSCENIVSMYQSAFGEDNSSFILREEFNPCRIELSGGKLFEKVVYILGGDSFTVYLPNNQMTKIPIDSYNRGYMIRMTLSSQIFSDEEVGNALTVRG